MPQLDFHLAYSNFVFLVLFFIIFYFFLSFSLLKKLIKFFLIRGFYKEFLDNINSYFGALKAHKSLTLSLQIKYLTYLFKRVCV